MHRAPSYPPRGRSVACALVALVVCLAAIHPLEASAAQCDCGQPLSSGPRPTVRDCLSILRIPLGLGTCDPCEPCVCDLDGSGQVTAVDVLICLQAAVGHPVDLTRCCGEPPPARYNGADFFFEEDGGVDLGWNGLGHGSTLAAGKAFSVGFAGQCRDSDAPCRSDAECIGERACETACRAGEPAAPACELYGPVGGTRCRSETYIACATNEDCPSSDTCGVVFGAPQPMVASGTPICLIATFGDDITGTHDLDTGTTSISTQLIARLRLGIAADQPCPWCGRLEQNPAIGDEFACEGGERDGEVCMVHAVSSRFGGTSNDCPPDFPRSVEGAGIPIPIDSLTTGSTSLQARIPCEGILGSLHPSTGNAVCLDDFSPCASNADCMRCAETLAACASDADCNAGDRCAAAPEQPVQCGIYCHCGVCSDDLSVACTRDEDCNTGASCRVAPGFSSSSQQNGCANFTCGEVGMERCCSEQDPGGCLADEPTPLIGHCMQQPHRVCSEDQDCVAPDTCALTGPRRCFEGVVTRTGEASPVRAYCTSDAADVAPCVTNSDCSTGACEPSVAQPTLASVTCPAGATSSAAINASFGLPGPLALRLATTLRYCECGDGRVGCAEECDDANTASGDGCDQDCRAE